MTATATAHQIAKKQADSAGFSYHDRKPVGIEECQYCEQTAVFLQVQKGRRKGLLYRRCGCGCDQSTGRLLQRLWFTRMERTGEPILEHDYFTGINYATGKIERPQFGRFDKVESINKNQQETPQPETQDKPKPEIEIELEQPPKTGAAIAAAVTGFAAAMVFFYSLFTGR